MPACRAKGEHRRLPVAAGRSGGEGAVAVPSENVCPRSPVGVAECRRCAVRPAMGWSALSGENANLTMTRDIGLPHGQDGTPADQAVFKQCPGSTGHRNLAPCADHVDLLEARLQPHAVQIAEGADDDLLHTLDRVKRELRRVPSIRMPRGRCRASCCSTCSTLLPRAIPVNRCRGPIAPVSPRMAAIRLPAAKTGTRIYRGREPFRLWRTK